MEHQRGYTKDTIFGYTHVTTRHGQLDPRDNSTLKFMYTNDTLISAVSFLHGVRSKEPLNLFERVNGPDKFAKGMQKNSWFRQHKDIEFNLCAEYFSLSSHVLDKHVALSY